MKLYRSDLENSINELLYNETTSKKLIQNGQLHIKNFLWFKVLLMYADNGELIIPRYPILLLRPSSIQP